MKKLFSNVGEVFLEVEVKPDRRDEFNKKYLALTGDDPSTSLYVQNQPDKWGLECRIYFNGDTKCIEELSKLGHHVETDRKQYRNEFSNRVNSQELFWELVKSGYRLGPN
ncbi:MAG: hypothetical protein WC383_18000 [Gammaproteobacteria bacterium]